MTNPPNLTRIGLLVLDFDGVMTDNLVHINQDGIESVSCSRSDGTGIEMARDRGLEILVLSKQKNPVVAARCKTLSLPVVQDCDNKLPALLQLASERQLTAAEVAFVGNDVNDSECIVWAGVGIAVADSHPDLLPVVDWVTNKPGGRGAVREVCDLWLAQNPEN